MTKESPRGDAHPAAGDADVRTRASLVSLGSSIAEDNSADISEVPLDATRDSASRGPIDAGAFAPASLDVTRESTGSGPDAGFNDVGTATPLIASPRVHHNPRCGVPPPADPMRHRRRANVPLPLVAPVAPKAVASRPPAFPLAAMHSSARAQALASSYSGSKPSEPSVSEKRASVAVASASHKTPAAAVSTRRSGPVYVPTGGAGAPQEAISLGFPPTLAGAFVMPAQAPSGDGSQPAPASETRDPQESPLGSAGFDSDEELSPSWCASVPEPKRRVPRVRPERGDAARSSTTPPAPRDKVPTPSPAPTAEPGRAAEAAAAPPPSEETDGAGDDGNPTRETVRASSVDAATVPEDAETIGQPWQLEPVMVAGTTLLLDPETRQTFLPPEPSARDGRMPTFCGRFAADGAFAPHRPLCDFLDAAKRFCQTRRVSVAELFRLYDDSAKLPLARFAKLVRECLSPAVSAAELAYTHAVLDRDGHGEVSPANVEACVREMAHRSSGTDDSRLGSPASATDSRSSRVRFAHVPDCTPRTTAPSLASFLERVADEAVASHGGSVARLFRSCAPKTSSTNSEGLDALGVLALVQKAFPRIARVDARVALAEARALDLDNDGLLSLQELRRGVRLAATARVVPGEGFGEPPDVSAGSEARSERRGRSRSGGRKERRPQSASKTLEKKPAGWKEATATRVEGGGGEAKKTETTFETNEGSRENVPPRRPGKPRERAPRAVNSFPMKPQEDLALRKRVRAARVRADKRVARGELFASEACEEVAEVEASLRAAAYERHLASRRAALDNASREARLEAETRAFREAQLAAFDAARAEGEAEERRRRRDAARRDAARLSGSADVSSSPEISEALRSKWREEEAYAVVETYGKKEVLAALSELAASKDDATGAFRSDEVARVSAELAKTLSAEDEARALDLVARAKDRFASEWTGDAEATPPAARPAETRSGGDAHEGGVRSSGDETPRRKGASSMFPVLFSGYPASAATARRSPRRFVVDGEARFAVEDRSFEKPMFMPPRNA